MITAVRKDKIMEERIESAINLTAVCMLELTKLKQEIEKEKQKKRLTLVK